MKMVFRKWKVLQSVQDRNETLFYRCLKMIKTLRPLSSTFVHFCPLSSTFVHLRPLSSTSTHFHRDIHFHPRSSTFVVIQIVDGQFLRDGSDNLHTNSRLGLQSLLTSLQKVQRSDEWWWWWWSWWCWRCRWWWWWWYIHRWLITSGDFLRNVLPPWGPRWDGQYDLQLASRWGFHHHDHHHHLHRCHDHHDHHHNIHHPGWRCGCYGRKPSSW